MRGFQNRDIRISIEKWPLSVPRIVIFDLLGVPPMWTYQNGAQVLYFLKVPKHFEKINFRTFFSDSEVQEIGFSRIRGPDRNPWKNPEKSQIDPGKLGKLWKPPQTYFLDFRRSLRSIWVIYQPRTNIFEEIVFLRSWGIFGRFPGNCISVVCGYVTSQEKNIIF